MSLYYQNYADCPCVKSTFLLEYMPAHSIHIRYFNRIDPSFSRGVAAILCDVYLKINQLDALNFIMSLFHASTCFEQMCSSSGGQNCIITLKL